MAKREPVETLALFDLADWPEPLVLPSGLTTRRRRTAEKLQRIALGLHPLTGLPLHPDAPRDTNRSRRLPQLYTCGTCLHLSQVPNIERSNLDCALSVYTGGARRWWPGCDQYKPKVTVKGD